jgi:hypothetical protein
MSASEVGTFYLMDLTVLNTMGGKSLLSLLLYTRLLTLRSPFTFFARSPARSPTPHGLRGTSLDSWLNNRERFCMDRHGTSTVHLGL